MKDITTHSSGRDGRIITFYSYKGGVGRSMALANTAVLLSRMGKKVLAVDWDLEAPGLNRYFKATSLTPPAVNGGLLRLLETASNSDQQPAYRHFVHSTSNQEFPTLDLLASGDEEDDYSSRVGRFSWVHFFRDRRGAQWLEKLRAQWKEDYDFVLIDSRTGITDSGGVCTVQLPDTLVFVVGANQQNLDGCKRIVSSIHRERANLPFDRGRLLILPVLSRFDGREESTLAKEWLQKCVDAFQLILNDWLPVQCTPLDLLERTKLPHVPRYSFGEELAVLSERDSDPDQLPYYYAATTRILESDFRDVLDILGKRIDRSDFGLSSDSPRNASVAYAAALKLARAGDVLGWRKLTQQVAAQFPEGLLTWQHRRQRNLPSGVDDLPSMALEGVTFSAPMMAVALAGVESQHSHFSKQIGLIDDFLNLPGWERSGSTILVNFPEMIAFVYQALVGGLALQTQQANIALGLANVELRNPYSNTTEALFRRKSVTGWPDSLNHTCTIAWKFLMDLPDHWTWLLSVFGDKDSYKATLGAYYMFLNVIEFLDAIDRGIDLVAQHSFSLTVPINFVSLSDQNQKKATRYFKESVPLIARLWKAKAVPREKMRESWDAWLAMAGHWVANVHRDGWPWGYDGMPLRSLPEWVSEAGS